MISNQRVKYLGRAAAILTTAAVPTVVVPTNVTLNGRVAVYVQFTLGSLTSATFNPQVSDDGGVTWYDVTDPGSLVLSASGNKEFSVDCSGSKQFRVTVLGTGVVTGSSATVNFGYQLAGGATG